MKPYPFTGGPQDGGSYVFASPPMIVYMPPEGIGIATLDSLTSPQPGDAVYFLKPDCTGYTYNGQVNR